MGTYAYILILSHMYTHSHTQTRRTALHLACARGHCDIVNHLLLMQASITACDSDGCTPMHKVTHSRYTPGGIWLTPDTTYLVGRGEILALTC